MTASQPHIRSTKRKSASVVATLVLLAGMITQQSMVSPASATVPAATQTANQQPSPEIRVVGGHNANRAYTKWFLQLEVRLMERKLTKKGDSYIDQMCGATAISSYWAVTAAHCLSPDGFKPSLGKGTYVIVNPVSNDVGTKIPITKVVIAPGFKPYATTQFNDIALFRVAKAFKTKLPYNTNKSQTTLGAAAQVYGFGRMHENASQGAKYLQQGNVKDLAGTSGPCGNYGSYYDARYQLCAGVPGGGIDACQGDSGGPLISTLAGKSRLIGIVSAGNGCAEADYPGIYTRVSTYADWIKKTTRSRLVISRKGCNSKNVCKLKRNQTRKIKVSNRGGSTGSYAISRSNSKLRVSPRKAKVGYASHRYVSFSTKSSSKRCVRVTFKAANSTTTKFVYALNGKTGCRV